MDEGRRARLVQLATALEAKAEELAGQASIGGSQLERLRAHLKEIAQEAKQLAEWGNAPPVDMVRLIQDSGLGQPPPDTVEGYDQRALDDEEGD